MKATKKKSGGRISSNDGNRRSGSSDRNVRDRKTARPPSTKKQRDAFKKALKSGKTPKEALNWAKREKE